MKGGVNMAIVSTDISARIRLSNEENKAIATYNGINPLVAPNNVEQFSNSVSALRVSPAVIKYVIVDTEISDDEEA
jgi:hypothetical protein